MDINVTANRHAQRSGASLLFKHELPELYLEKLKISQAKNDNFLTMSKKLVIPELFQAWFEKLHCDSRFGNFARRGYSGF